MKIGDIVTVDVPLGTGTHVLRPRKCRVLAAYNKKQLGVMYLLETIKGGFKTCVVVPPAPRFQPEKVSTAHRWEKVTKVDIAEPILDEVVHYRKFRTFEEMLDALGIDKSIKRSTARLRNIAFVNHCEVVEDGHK